MSQNVQISNGTARRAKKFADITVDYNGSTFSEDEIIAMATLIDPADRLHYHADKDGELLNPTLVLPYLTPLFPAWTRQRSDMQGRIIVEAGNGEAAKQVLLEWAKEHNAPMPAGLRVESKGVSFLDVAAIPEDLRNGLVLGVMDAIWGLPAMAKIRGQIVADHDLVGDEDVWSMLYEFINDLFDQFNNTRESKMGTHLNLTAFVWGKLKNWPQDLLRRSRGRGFVDTQVSINKAIDEFKSDNHRSPSTRELATHLSMTVDDLLAKQRMSETFTAMSFAAPLVSAFDGNDEDRSYVLADEAADTEAAAVMRSRNAALSRAVITAAKTRDKKSGPEYVDPIALTITHMTVWGEQSNSDVAVTLGVTQRAVTKAFSRLSDEVRANADAI